MRKKVLNLFLIFVLIFASLTIRIVSTDSSVTYGVSNISQALRKEDKGSLSP